MKKREIALIAGIAILAIYAATPKLQPIVTCKSMPFWQFECHFINSNYITPISDCVKVRVHRSQRSDESSADFRIFGEVISAPVCPGLIVPMGERKIDTVIFPRHLSEVCKDGDNCATEVTYVDPE